MPSVAGDVFDALCWARRRLGEPSCDRPVSQLAVDVGMSPFHFIRRFDLVFGVTPHQYRIRARLARARRLLEDTDLPVTDICLEVGFSSLGSFSSAFRRRVGVSPSTYRRSPARPPGCFALMGLSG